MRVIKTIIALVTLLMTATNCSGGKGPFGDDKEGDDGNGGVRGSGGGNGSGSENVFDKVDLYLMRATTDAALQLAAEDATEAGDAIDSCQAWTNHGPENGQCATPLNLKGHASRINLQGDSDGGCGPARLLQVNHEGDTGLPGRGGGLFDVSNPEPMGGGSNLYCEGYKEATWTGMTVGMAYVDAQFAMHTGQVWTVRFVFDSNPISNEPAVAAASCDLKDDFIAAWNYIESVSYQRGDVLLCKKDSADETCAESDFKWLDTETSEFSTTRPTTPHQMGYMRAFTDSLDGDYENADIWCRTDCDMRNGEPYCGFSLGGYDLSFKFDAADQFKLYAESVKSDDPRYPSEVVKQAAKEGEAEDTSTFYPDAYLYTFEKDGQTSSGFQMDVNISFDLDGFIFFDTLDEVDVMSDAAIFKTIHIKDMFAREERKNYGYTPNQSAVLDVEFAE